MDYLEIRELYHHGIKGQKWGIRRFQNEDGSLTAEGKKRYDVAPSGQMSRTGQKLYQKDLKEYHKEQKQQIEKEKIASRSTLSNTSIGALKGGTLVGAGMALTGFMLTSYGALSAASGLFDGKTNFKLDEAATLTGYYLMKGAPVGAAVGSAAGASIGAAKSEKYKRELGK